MGRRLDSYEIIQRGDLLYYKPGSAILANTYAGKRVYVYLRNYPHGWVEEGAQTTETICAKLQIGLDRILEELWKSD